MKSQSVEIAKKQNTYKKAVPLKVNKAAPKRFEIQDFSLGSRVHALWSKS